MQVASLRTAHEQADAALARRTAELAAARAEAGELRAAAGAAVAGVAERQAEADAAKAAAADLKVSTHRVMASCRGLWQGFFHQLNQALLRCIVFDAKHGLRVRQRQATLSSRRLGIQSHIITAASTSHLASCPCTLLHIDSYVLCDA